MRITPGKGEWGWRWRELSYAAFVEWRARGYEGSMPTREEMENRDELWRAEVYQWIHLDRYTQDMPKWANQMRGAGAPV